MLNGWTDAAAMLPDLTPSARDRITAAVDRHRGTLARSIGRDAANRARLVVKMHGDKPVFGLQGFAR